MPGQLKKYAFINAKLRARISKLLSDEFIDRLVKTHTLVEIMQLLRATYYSFLDSVYTRTGDIKMCEYEIQIRELELYSEIEGYVTGEVLHFVVALTTRFEINNLKNALRLWFERAIRGRNIEEGVGYLYREKIHYDLKLDRIISSDSLEEIAYVLNDTPYGRIIRDNAGLVQANKSIFPVEIKLDQYFYDQLTEAAEELKGRDRDIARRMIGIEIDIQNISWIIRLKELYGFSLKEAAKNMIPHGYMMTGEIAESVSDTENITERLTEILKKRHSALGALLGAEQGKGEQRLELLEHILDEITQYEVRHILSGYPFTIGIILAYFILKEKEMDKIITIINAKYYNIPPDKLKEAL